MWCPTELCANQPEGEQLKLGCVDEQSARDLLHCMYRLIYVVHYHKAFRDSKVLSLTRQTRDGPRTPLKPAPSTSDVLLKLFRLYLGRPCMPCCAVLCCAAHLHFLPRDLHCRKSWLKPKQWAQSFSAYPHAPLAIPDIKCGSITCFASTEANSVRRK